MSLRDFFSRITPAHHTVREHPHLRMFGERLHDPNIWRLTRRSVAGGVAAGVLCAAMPTVGQMIMAALLAIAFRVNLPVAVAFTWVSNPVTIPPLLYISYKIGNRILGTPMQYHEFHLSFTWLQSVLHDIWLPLWIGGFIIGGLSAALGYYIISGLWRLLLIRKRDDRRVRRPFMRIRIREDDEQK